MRIVVIGAGAIGGVIGAHLHQHGTDVALVARGPHLAAIKTHGLRVETPDRDVTLDIPAYADVRAFDWRAGDVALLAVKSQHTVALLPELAAVAPPGVPVVCAQNGVDNERQALRWFADVYGINVLCPATFLDPGVVQAHCSPIPGLLDIGRYPDGTDATAKAVAATLAAAGFDSRPVDDIMRWKYGKLILNLGNAVQIVFGLSAGAEITARARDEGAACLEAVGIPFVSREQDTARRGDLLKFPAVDGGGRGASSTWQSIARGAGSVETDFLNGEIVLLGRQHGVPVPVNQLLQHLATEVATGRRALGSVSEAEFLDQLAAFTRPE